MKLKRIPNEFEISFYDGISLTQYQDLSKRWSEILSIVHKEVMTYINENSFDDGTFPDRRVLTGDYYIESVSYSSHVNPFGFQLMVQTIHKGCDLNDVDDYLGLEVTLFTPTIDGDFVVWGVDSSVA